MQKKTRRGRVLPKREVIKNMCNNCGEWLEYGGTYYDGEICLNMVDIGYCPSCNLVHQVMWVDKKPIVYTSSTPLWLYAAGHKVTEKW